jgi:VanZ family protein
LSAAGGYLRVRGGGWSQAPPTRPACYDRPMLEVIARIVGSQWLRWLAAACVVAIAVLSLVPRSLEGANASLVHGPPKHFTAYLVAAVLIGLGARRRPNPAVLVVALAAYAGVLEILQNFSPGRDPAWEGFLSSSLGAVVGTALVAIFRRS